MAVIGLFLLTGTWRISENLLLEQDVVSSLHLENPREQRVFDAFSSKNLFQKKTFVQIQNTEDTTQLKSIVGLFANAGYEMQEPGAGADPAAVDLSPLVTALDQASIAKLFSKEAETIAVQRLLTLSTIPGGGPALANLQKDPLMLRPQLIGRFLQRLTAPVPGKLLIFERVGGLDYDKVGRLYDVLAKITGIHFIGSDFFSYENYRTIKSDIKWATALSLIGNFLLFFFFCRSLALLGFLLIGTMISYVSGLLVLQLLFPTIFAVVLAFSSTFIGFNNEYVVHFAGIRKEARLHTFIGLGSAIGTTFIGFIVLLFSHSEVIRQMAVISLAAGVGFIAFMLSYQGYLSRVTFRTINLPRIGLSRRALNVCCLVLIGLISLLPKPKLVTEIRNFRVMSPLLTEQLKVFESYLTGSSLVNLFATPVEPVDDMLKSYIEIEAKTSGFHPLKTQVEQDESSERITAFVKAYRASISAVNGKLTNQVPRLDPSPHWLESLAPASAITALETWNKLSPSPWSLTVDGKNYLLVHLPEPESGSIALDPVRVYNGILTGLQNDMLKLFLIGLFCMFIYLFPLQRQLSKITYIFFPLLATTLAYQIGFAIFRLNLNFIDMVGLALVISLALDYSAITVSAGTSSVEPSKVLLTGLGTIMTFGALGMCEHPVMRNLGLVVAVGAAVSLAVTMFLYLPEAET